MFKKRYSGRENQTGFTLVEIVVASVLLAIISAGIFSVTLASRRIISNVNKRQVATQVADAVLGSLRNYLGMDQWNDTGSPIYLTPNPICYALTDPADFLNMTTLYGSTELAQKYQGQWCYQVVAGPSGSEYRQVWVNVTWVEP